VSGHFSALLAGGRTAADGRARIPVTVLTGFLGSGKTTLLNRLLREPDLHGTAVIVNEFGAIGIDHDLIAQTTEDTVLLANGCMCCAVRGDLVAALAALGARGAGGDDDVPPLRQVLIETSGLADPAPILRTLMGDPAVKDRFALAGVCCTVDAVLAPGTLDRHPEAERQVARADRLLFTKTDLLAGEPVAPALIGRVTRLNPTASLHAHAGEHVEVLHRTLRTDPDAIDRDAVGDGPFYRPPPAAEGADAPSPHPGGIRSFVIVRDEPLPRDGFQSWLDTVIAMRGEDLLRVKGIVNLAEEPERPLVFHGVQHLYEPPEFLPAWPSADRRTRIVFITRGVDAEALDESLRVFARRRRSRPAPDPSPTTTETP
jgi:G3E family GTPase